MWGTETEIRLKATAPWLCLLIYSFFFSRTERKPYLWDIPTCCFNHVFDVLVWQKSFEHEPRTRGHESASAHAEKEEELEHKGTSLGAELSR